MQRLKQTATYSAIFMHAMTLSLADVNKTITVGNQTFGTEGNFSLMERPEQRQYTATAMARGDGFVFSRRIEIAAGEASVTVPTASAAPNRTKGYFRFGGKTVSSWDKSFSQTTTFTSPPLVNLEPSLPITFPILFAHVSIKPTLLLKAYLYGELSVSYDSRFQRPAIGAAFGPRLDAGVALAGEIGIWLAGVGVKGSVAAEGLGVTGRINYDPPLLGVPDRGSIRLGATADLQRIVAKLDAYVWGLFWKHERNLYSWPIVGRQSHTLVSKSFKL